MTVVILDTNVLLEQVSAKLDLFGELAQILPGCQLILPVQVIAELGLLSKGSGKTAVAAKLAQRLLEGQALKTDGGSLAKSADDAIVKIAKAGDYVVTLDAALIARLKAKGVRIVGVRQRNRLYIHEDVL